MTLSAVNYGTDVSSVPDLTHDMHVVGGRKLVAQALYNRFRTRRGTLKDDLNYGTDLEQFLNEDFGNVSSLQGRVTSAAQAEAVKDERVRTASASVSVNAVYGQSEYQLVIALTVTLSVGPTFLLVLGVSQLGVQLLQSP